MRKAKRRAYHQHSIKNKKTTTNNKALNFLEKQQGRLKLNFLKRKYLIEFKEFMFFFQITL